MEAEDSGSKKRARILRTLEDEEARLEAHLKAAPSTCLEQAKQLIHSLDEKEKRLLTQNMLASLAKTDIDNELKRLYVQLEERSWCWSLCNWEKLDNEVNQGGLGMLEITVVGRYRCYKDGDVEFEMKEEDQNQFVLFAKILEHMGESDFASIGEMAPEKWKNSEEYEGAQELRMEEVVYLYYTKADPVFGKKVWRVYGDGRMDRGQIIEQDEKFYLREAPATSGPTKRILPAPILKVTCLIPTLY